MVPSHASKAGKRYRYYVSRSPVREGVRTDGGWRLPAKQIETVVMGEICSLLRDRARLIEHLGLLSRSPGGMKALLGEAAGFAEWLADAGPSAQRASLLGILDRIEVRPERLAILVRAGALARRIQQGGGGPGAQGASSDREDTFSLEVSFQVRRCGAEMKLVLTGGGRSPVAPDPKLIGAIASAHAWYEELRDGAVGSVGELAKRVGCDRADVGRTIRLAFLAPDIVEAILSGRQPADLTLTRLKRLGDLPLSWSEQRELLRFDH